ncbi:PREDICTED: uncharacterized protein LOC109221004 [Nicotiana attenuata]|uniref:uncharacterized protein LOC109221004 n=1 Tax=Nicotiana attenuata TaxID=49451 RepID=UPI0009046FA8|nr:PREDICTED: uncharacterized protein LOC109221004 [Nicotiana attenuata]
MEPKQKKKNLERYRRRIGMLQAFANVSNKIWVFVDEDHGVEIIYDLEQQMTLKLTNLDTQMSFMVTFVYAKCDPIERIELWDSLYYLASDMSIPWLVGGDFNVILDEEEKFGGLPVSLNEINDFRHCISTCNLNDLGFKGSIYTWWNGRGEDDCIFKRLDRCLGNVELQQMWPNLEITHLSKTGSDHSPMLLQFLALEEEFWKQKSGMAWFKDGDRNTKFFHAQVNGRRRRLQLKRVQNSNGIWLEDSNDMADEAVRFFKAQFHEDQVPTCFEILEHIPTLIDNLQNLELIKQPTFAEVKQAVFGLNGESAGGPDGFTGCFFHHCWEIIADDIVEMVKAFFNGHELPRLTGLVTNIISEEQAGFVKGRSIVENVLLTQEIITDIRMRTKAGPNVVIKLDMAKAYDRLSWIFLTKWSPKINHLAYADDTIIFSSSDATSLRLIMEILAGYEKASGQLINKSKSAIYLHHSAGEDVVDKVQRITGIAKNEFPFTYLGCPIFYARRRMNYYQGLITKVMDKLQDWKGKLLSIGGRAVLISHVLQSMPIHLLSSVNPPPYVINKLHKIFAQFFWSNTVGVANRHWASWNTLCLPCEEGGVGFRSLHDVSTALFCKLWWNFRTKPSLWSSFLSQKYCKKLNPMIVPWRDGSHVWRKMLECRDIIEHQIWWQPHMGSSLFWFENWTGMGSLYFVTPPDFVCDESIHNIYDVVCNGQWNEEKIREILPEELAEHILQHVKPPGMIEDIDKPYWMLEPRGKFTVKSAWAYVRRRNDPGNAYRNIWVKGLPFKISFFMWKVWRNKLPLDEFFKRLGYLMASKCWCCAEPQEETMQHLFYTSHAAIRVWKYFLGHAGITLEGISFHQAIVKCWTADVIHRIKPILQALPSVIVWELWKRRNSYKHGDTVTVNRVIYQVSNTMQSLVKFKKPNLQNVPHKWPDLLYMLESYLPRLKYTKVLWECPKSGWIKVNTDGASKGNPGRSSIGYVLRNEKGDIVYGCGKEVQNGTNTEAEAKAILEAMKFCVRHEYVLIELHTDSMMMKHVITGEWDVPWNIAEHVEEIKELMNRTNVTVTHTLREGNRLADHLANYALDFGDFEAHNFWELDIQGRKIVNDDKSQCPYIRIRVA